MSRYYEAKIEIEGFDESKSGQIQDACREAWGFAKDDWFCFERAADSVRCMEAVTRGNLCGGETEEEFSERLAKVVWQANGGCCRVTVNTLYLDEVPYEAYVMDEDNYEEIMNRAES